jgi:hypothetical protein
MFVTPAFAQAAPGGAASAFTSFVPLILIFAIMYFLLIRPQQKKQKEHKAMVEALRGQTGVLSLQKLTVDSFEKQEYLLFSALTTEGHSLDQETCEKLMATAASVQAGAADTANQAPRQPPAATHTRLQLEAQRHAQATVAQALETNNAHFTDARDKLDRWADDMELAAEQALKNTKEQIKVAQREARHAPPWPSNTPFKNASPSSSASNATSGKRFLRSPTTSRTSAKSWSNCSCSAWPKRCTPNTCSPCYGRCDDIQRRRCHQRGKAPR